MQCMRALALAHMLPRQRRRGGTRPRRCLGVGRRGAARRRMGGGGGERAAPHVVVQNVLGVGLVWVMGARLLEGRAHSRRRAAAVPCAVVSSSAARRRARRRQSAAGARRGAARARAASSQDLKRPTLRAGESECRNNGRGGAGRGADQGARPRRSRARGRGAARDLLHRRARAPGHALDRVAVALFVEPVLFGPRDRLGLAQAVEQVDLLGALRGARARAGAGDGRG